MVTEKEARAAFHEGYLGVAAGELLELADVELAQLQAQYPSGSAQGILAEKEWQRRLSVRQLQEQFRLDSRLAEATNNAMKFAAIIGVVGTLTGAGLGAYSTLKASSGQTSPSATQPQAQAIPGMSTTPPTPAKAPAPAASK